MKASAITKGAIISYVAIFLNIAITFVYTPWMIHTIGQSNYGLYSLVSSFIGYFILDFGMATSIARFVSKYRAEGREDKIENMLGLTTRLYLLIDLVIFLVLLVLYFFINNIFTGLTPDEIETFKRLYIVAGVFSVCSFVFKPVNGAMMAYEYFVENKVLDMVTRVGTVLLVAIALLLGGDVFILVLINGAVGFAVSVIKYVVLIRKSKLKIMWSYFEKEELKVLFSFSLWIFLMGLAQRFRFTLVQSVLGIFSNSMEISLFALGMTIEAMVFTISSALNGLFLPKVTRLSLSGDKDSILELMTRVGRLQLYLIVLIFSEFLIFGQTFLHLWVGDGFQDVYYIVLLLIASNIVSLTQSVGNDCVFAENKVKYTSLSILICSTIGIIGSVIFSKPYGALGCAASTCFALVANVVMTNIIYKRQLNLNVGQFFKNCHFKILLPLTGLAILSMFVFPLVLKNSWLSLLGCGGAYCVVFILLSYLFLMDGYEKSLISSLVKKF